MSLFGPLCRSNLPACNSRWESALQPVWNYNISNSRLPPYYDNLSSLLVMLRKKPVCSPALVLGGTLEFRNHGRSVWLARKQFLNLNGENNILFTCYVE